MDMKLKLEIYTLMWKWLFSAHSLVAPNIQRELAESKAPIFLMANQQHQSGPSLQTYY